METLDCGGREVYEGEGRSLRLGGPLLLLVLAGCRREEPVLDVVLRVQARGTPALALPLIMSSHLKQVASDFP